MRRVHEFEMGAIPPYSFELTVNKPAGWWWATPNEIYDKCTLWTATRFRDKLIGVKLWNLGTLGKPRMRWGQWTGHAFVYVLNDLEKISKRISVDLTKY